MDDNSLDRPIKAEVSGIVSPSKGPHVVDSGSTGWTDEKHSLYLSSMEASFVNQLRKSKCNSKDLLGSFSRTQEHRNSSRSNANGLTSGQFKVLRGGCWENLKFERPKSHIEIENECRSFSSNPWIRHFRSPSIAKETHLTSYQVEDMVFSARSTELATQRHGREATSTKQLLACPQKFFQDSVGSTIEVSGQNFVDDEFEGMEQSNTTCQKRRRRTAVADQLVHDQVVPSVKSQATPSSGENLACLDERDAECSTKTLEMVERQLM